MQVKTIRSLESLMVSFLAELTKVESKEEVVESTWIVLARQLVVPLEHLTGYWGIANQDAIWARVLDRRIENVAANQAFRGASRDRVAYKVINRIEALLDQNMVKDVGELAAIYRLTASPNGIGNGQGVTVNIGDSAMRLENGETLPGGDKIVHLSLSPIVAQSVTRARELGGERVIDGEMIDAKTLRTIGGESEFEMGAE